MMDSRPNNPDPSCIRALSNGENPAETVEYWNQPTYDATYTPLETFRPEGYNYFPTGFQNLNLYGTLSQFNNNIIPDVGSPANFNLYDTKDEGLGSSPSSFHSDSPPAIMEQNASENLQDIQQKIKTESDSDYRDHREGPSFMPLFHEEPTTQCVKCGTSFTRGRWFPDNTGHFLCNYCYQMSQVYSESGAEDKKRKKSVGNKGSDITCSNCQTLVTPLWRRTKDGNVVCNACGLYEKLHQRTRPLSMKKDIIQTRKRKPRSKAKSASSDKGNASINNQEILSAAEAIHNTSSVLHHGQSASELHTLHHSGTVVLPSMNSAISSAFYNNYPPDLHSVHIVSPGVIVPLEKPAQISLPET